MATKRERRRLARSELMVQLSLSAQRWADELRPGATTRPPEEWGADDPMVSLARRYNLTFEDLANLCEGLAQNLEDRALRTGFEEIWSD